MNKIMNKIIIYSFSCFKCDGFHYVELDGQVAKLVSCGCGNNA